MWVRRCSDKEIGPNRNAFCPAGRAAAATWKSGQIATRSVQQGHAAAAEWGRRAGIIRARLHPIDIRTFTMISHSARRPVRQSIDR